MAFHAPAQSGWTGQAGLSSSSMPPVAGHLLNIDHEVETLFDHPNVKIVSFACGGAENAAGALPWTSPLERTIAVGTFTIYRAPGSVAFISCRSALQPILRKSQCWCVDEDSTKFVLQIRRPHYWRIELLELAEHGAAGGEKHARSLALRHVLDRILQFEKTECPFQRSFTVELPELPPVKIIPWMPRPTTPQVVPEQRAVLSLPSRWQQRRLTSGAVDSTRTRPDDVLFGTSRPREIPEADTAPIFEDYKSRRESASAFEARKQYWQLREFEGADDIDAGKLGPSRPRTAGPHGTVSRRTSLPDFRAHGTWRAFPRTDGSVRPPDGSGDRPTAILAPPATRTISPPPQPSLAVSPISQSAGKPSETEEGAEEPGPPLSTPEGSPSSFRSTYSWPTSPVTPPLTSRRRGTHSDVRSTMPHDQFETLQPSPPLPDVPANFSHDSGGGCASNGSAPGMAEHMDHTTAPNTSRESGAPGSPAHPNGGAAELTLAERPRVRHRSTISSISVGPGTFSPLLPGTNLFSPSHAPAIPSTNPDRTMARIRGVPMTIITKMVDAIFGPPKYLIALMLRVAARITAGQWRGFASGTGEHGERIPVQWDYSDEDVETNRWDSCVEQDVLGGIQGVMRQRSLAGETRKREGQSYEVD